MPTTPILDHPDLTTHEPEPADIPRALVRHAPDAQQIKELNRLLDGDQDSFAHGISASQYQALTKVSQATETRASQRFSFARNPGVC
nr:hypothetical protein [Pseudomonas protegens]